MDPNTGLFENREDMPRFQMTSDAGGQGFEATVDTTTNTLQLKVGFSPRTHPSRLDEGLATSIAELFHWLEINDGRIVKFQSNNNYWKKGMEYIALGFTVK